MVAQATSLMWIILGASLLGTVMHVSIPPLTWLALTFLLHGSETMPPLPGLAVVWLALYIAQAIGRRGMLPIPGPGYFAIIALEATVLVIPFIVHRLAAARLPSALAILVFPASLVAVELLRSRSFGSWGSIAYTQYGFLSLMQVAAFAGIWGITFLVGWFASTVELAWSHGFDWNVVRVPVLTYASTFALVIIGGSVRLASAPSERPSLRVATVNRPLNLFIPGEITRISEGRVSAAEREPFGHKLAQLQDWFLDSSRREARAGARLILWPEGNLLVFSDDEPSFLTRARRLAADERVYLAMGMGTIHLGEQLPFENKLILIDPSGNAVMSYRKIHPVIGWEKSIMKVGNGGMPAVATKDGTIAGAICFDADFPDFIRQAAMASADLIVLPVNEWKEVKEIHFQMHAFRAIETGTPLVRAAASGLSAAFDSRGRVLGVADYFSSGDRTLSAQVPVGRVWTMYAKTGDLFAWLCVAGLVLTLAVVCGQILGLITLIAPLTSLTPSTTPTAIRYPDRQ
jgi:apolipoprotein N-acyltransferase